MVYLDHHAATPLSNEARSAMRAAEPWTFANPSSIHRHGRRARELVEEARAHVAASISTKARNVVFTSGGTEAVNLGVRGLAARARRIVTTRLEHPAVTESVAHCATAGKQLTFLEVSAANPFSLETLAYQLTPDTLVAIQWVNHETGILFPIELVALACRNVGASLFVDATQALGKVPIDFDSLGCAAIALASHKIGGPSGAGALVVGSGDDVVPIVLGGEQERGRRAGTPDVAALVGFGAACKTVDERLESMDGVGERRDRIESALAKLGAVVNGAELPRVATVTNASLRGARGSLLVAALDVEGLSLSSGAACSSGLDRPSPVLSALYANEPWRAGSAVRASLGPDTTDADVDEAIAILDHVLPRFSAA